MEKIVYILTNEAMPDYVKVGITDNLEQRIKDLYKTSVPLPFVCFYACLVENGKEVETWLFDIFADRRVSKEREFFKVGPERIVAALRSKAIEDVTPRPYTESEADKEALEEARSRRDRFDFSKVKIPLNSELTFSRNENEKARVVDDNHIEYKGEVTSLSSSAKKILGYDYAVAGTLYWMYEDETLDERRRRIEENE